MVYPKTLTIGWGKLNFHRQLVVVAVLLVLVKLVAAAREVLLARTYGIGPLMDAYQFTSNLASWPVSIFFAVCSASLIPAYASARARGADPLMRLRSQAHCATVILSLLLAAIWVAMCAFTPLLGSWGGLSEPTRSYAHHFVLPMAATIFCGVYASLLSTECISIRSHGNILLEATPALVMLGLLGFWQPADEALLLTGTVAGAVATLAVMLPYLAYRFTLPRLSLEFDPSQWSTAIAVGAVLLVAQCLQAATSIMDQFWAAQLSHGALSVMGYASRIYFAVAGIGAVAVTRTMLPVLAEWQIDQSQRGHDTALSWSFWLFGLGALMVAVLWPLTPWLVSAIYERGAFGASETVRVADFLQASWLQVPASLASLVLIQQLLAQRKYSALVGLATSNLLVKALGNLLLTPALGLVGLAVSSALMQLSTYLLLLWWHHRGSKA